MAALHADEEWFCRAAWRCIAARRTQPDIVHAHALHQAARLRQGSARVVINLPGAPSPRYTDDLRKADALVADGWAARQLPERLGRAVSAIPKGVDATLFTPEGPNRRQTLGLEGRRVVLAVGRLVPIKNTRLLLDATAIARHTEPALHLLIVGEGTEAAMLRAHVGDLGIADAVTFAGYVPHHETPAFYRAADVFALTSDFDNSPNAVLEAMACGLPVVATDAGGARDFVDAAGGELVPPRDATAIARAILGLLADRSRAAQAARHNRRAAVERFSWCASAERLLDVYRGVLQARTPA
jgi:D-inositol-3-phosphate glycosyltransferase